MKLPPLFGRGQVSLCSGCGSTLRERKRRPCPRCGSTARTLARTVTETLGAADKA